MTNPLLAAWKTPYGLPPFDMISDQDYAPAVDAALTEARANIATIAENPEPPTFANTIEAMERAEDTLNRVLGAFYNVAGADSNDRRDALQREFAPLLSAYGSEIIENKALFARIEAIWDMRDALDLTDEQARVLMLTRRGFVRAGAQLEGADAARLREVKSRCRFWARNSPRTCFPMNAAGSCALPKTTLKGCPISSSPRHGRRAGRKRPMALS